MSNLPSIQNRDAATSVSASYTHGGAAGGSGSNQRAGEDRNLVYNEGEPLPPVEFIVTTESLPPYNALSDPNLLPYWSRQAELIHLRKEQQQDRKRREREEERQRQQHLQHLQERQRRDRREARAREEQRRRQAAEAELERQRVAEARQQRLAAEQRERLRRRRRQQRREGKAMEEERRRRERANEVQRQRELGDTSESSHSPLRSGSIGSREEVGSAGHRHHRHRRHHHRHFHRNRFGEVMDRREEMPAADTEDATEVVCGGQYSSHLTKEGAGLRPHPPPREDDSTSSSEDEEDTADPNCKCIQTEPYDGLSLTGISAAPPQGQEVEGSAVLSSSRQDSSVLLHTAQRASDPPVGAPGVGEVAPDDTADSPDAEEEEEEEEEEERHRSAASDRCSVDAAPPAAAAAPSGPVFQSPVTTAAAVPPPDSARSRSSVGKSSAASSSVSGGGVDHHSGRVRYNNNTVLCEGAAPPLPTIGAGRRVETEETEETRQAVAAALLARQQALQDAQEAAAMRAKAAEAYEEAREAAVEAREAAEELRAVATASSHSRSREGPETSRGTSGASMRVGEVLDSTSSPCAEQLQAVEAGQPVEELEAREQLDEDGEVIATAAAEEAE